jgi:hypothetical protein
MSAGATQPDRTSPLTDEEVGRFDAPAGGASTRLDLAGLTIDLTGLPAALAEAMRSRYTAWMGDVSGSTPALRIQVVSAPLDYFLPPEFTTRAQNYRVITAYDGSVFRATSYRLAWRFDLAGGEGRAVLARGDLDPAPRAVENMLRSAVAWLAIGRGGLFLHGASIVRNGACYLFYGPTGAGKSTLASLSASGRVISDDLTLVLRRDGRLLAAGGPFRGTYTRGEPVTGTFPVAGLYRLRKDQLTSVRPGDAACFADLVANLPWVVEQLPRHPHLFDHARDVVRDVPLHYLHFSMNGDFWPAVDAGPRQP